MLELYNYYSSICNISFNAAPTWNSPIPWLGREMLFFGGLCGLAIIPTIIAGSRNSKV